MTPEEFRQYGYQIIDWIADYRANVAEHSVMSTIEPGTIKESLPAMPPATPEPFTSILEDLNQTLLPGITHWAHPNYFAYSLPMARSPRYWAICSVQVSEALASTGKRCRP